MTNQKAKTGAKSGNKNAQKGDEPATSYLHARCCPSDKAAWVHAANRRGLKLTEWVVQALNRAAGK